MVRGAWQALGGRRDPAAPTKLLDFAATGLRVELPVAARYHVGGDVLAPVHRFTVTLAPGAVQVLRPRAT